MPLKFNSITLLISSLITGGGAWLGYELSKPSNVKGWLEWRGLKLASETDENIWKALYFQQEAKLKAKDIKEATELKKFCITAWNESVKQSNKAKDVEEFCTEVLKSRKARMIASGMDEKKLLGGEESNEDYKISFIVNSTSPTFLSLLGENLNKNSPLEDAVKVYKKYCEEALNEDVAEYIRRTYQICTKPAGRTIGELLESQGYTDLNDSEIESSWKEVQKLKDSNTLLKAISDEGQDKQWEELKKTKDLFSKQLKKWCDAEKVKKLETATYYSETYPSVKSRCVRKRN